RRPLAAARLFANAFAKDPKLADDLHAHHRYNAACYAALTGGGPGKDTEGLDDKERARWRQQALDWLRADLAAYAKELKNGQSAAVFLVVRPQLARWQRDANLVG